MKKILSTGVGFALLLVLCFGYIAWGEVVRDTPESSVWHQPANFVQLCILMAIATLFGVADPRSNWKWSSRERLILGAVTILVATLYCVSEVVFDFRASHWIGTVIFFLPMTAYAVHSFVVRRRDRK